MPNASAPNAPCVAVWLSPQTTVMPGCVKPELRPDHVHDALAVAMHTQAADAELGAIGFQLRQLPGGNFIHDRQRPVRGGNAVVGGGDGEVRPAHLEAPLAQPLEGLRRGDFVDQVQIDEQQRGRARAVDGPRGRPRVFR